jgi:hypothetical protein
MIFRQRMTVTDLALYTWAPIQTALLRASGSLADLWSARAGRLSTSTIDNSQIATAMAVGIFIGLGAGTLLADQLILAISYVAPLWSVALLQLTLQQGSKMRQREQLPACCAGERLNQQQGQNQTSKWSVPRVIASIPDDEAVTPLVEDALRHLHDCSYLGQHQLAQLQLVKRQQQLCSGGPGLNTHLELGRALHSLLVDIIGQLRPPGQLPTGAVVPQREWHPYIILNASYVQGELTREIMARLYISEGTYNRTRRRAIYSVARAILEIEHQTRTLCFS